MKLEERIELLEKRAGKFEVKLQLHFFLTIIPILTIHRAYYSALNRTHLYKEINL